ncbi:MAG: hypothetical protein JRH01_11660 [Deltaproteobacteria bacterium]|nr:hypothetical protein [Deltaproteobacteria bacterium]MBW2397082.1 hypothetical protein [Deltaproteobacteria bacterium]
MHPKNNQVFAHVIGCVSVTLAVLACGAGPNPHAATELGDRRYSVVITAPPELPAGSSGHLVLEARPQAGHKLSTDFPTRLVLLSSSGLDAPTELDREAAEELREQTIRYAAPILARKRGSQTIEGKLRIGVCTGNLCEPVELPFEVNLLVTGGS